MDGSLKARTLFEEKPKTMLIPQEKPFLAREYRRIAENQPMQAPSSPFSRRIYQRRFDQEQVISMSRMSLFGLISGLMLLGVLFFMAGFLVALGTLEPPKPPAPPPSSSWGDMNTPPGAVSKGVQAQRGVFASMAQQQVSQAGTAAMKFVPKPLQPFAQPLKSQGMSATQGVIKGKKSANPAQQQLPPAPQPGGPMPDSIQPGQDAQQSWSQPPQQAYMPPPATTYVPPPPATYSQPPYPHY